jgi:dCMP deaminase
MGMTGYKIGNVLRGYICFSAATDHEAWDKGRAKFNEACPTDHDIGRQVELYVSMPVPITAKYAEYDESPEGWFPVLIGYSGESYPVKTPEAMSDLKVAVQCLPEATRPTRDDWLLAVALETAKRSTCLRRRYGAVVATPAGEILSTGYNGAPRGQPHCAEAGCRRQALGIPQGERYELCRAVHAEMNALLQAGRAAEGCTLYLAGYAVGSGLAVDATPCLLCARAAVNRGIAEVVMRRVPPRQPARADPVAILASLEEAAEGAARVAASRGIGAEERQIGGSRP